MKKYILLLLVMFSFISCETGTRYDKNATTQKAPKAVVQSGLVDRDDIEALLEDESEIDKSFDDEKEWIDPNLQEESLYQEELNSFSSSNRGTTLDVSKIREGKHEGYLRLVFDVVDKTNAAKSVGQYDAKYRSSKKDIAVILYGYQNFSAPLPSFPYTSLIEQIYFEQYPKEKGFKFHIKLRQKAEVKIFDLKNPARLVFDIKAI